MPEQQDDSPAWAPELERSAAEVMAQHGIPGMALAVARDGRALHEAGWGVADREREIPATPDTVFGIASAAKPFTALPVMRLQDAGALSVEDSVARWLPVFTLPHPQDRRHLPDITIHHLLTHTSGLPVEQAIIHARVASVRSDPDRGRIRPPAHGASWGDIDAMSVATTYEELLAINARLDYRLLAAPGTCFSYSNEGYAFLAAIVERATGRAFPEYVRSEILEPLGLARTSFHPGGAPPPGAAQLYATGEDGLFPSPYLHGMGQVFGGGGMLSTVRDLLRFLEVFRNGGAVDGRRLVSAAAVARMLAPHARLTDGRAYGYGFFVQPHHGMTLVEHGGGNKGIGASMALVPEADLTVAVLSNVLNEGVRDAQLAAIGLALGLPPGAERPQSQQGEHALPAERLARFAGVYGSPFGGHPREAAVFAFSEEEGTLAMKRGQQWVPVRPIAEDTVFAPGPGGGSAIRFLLDERGGAYAMLQGLRAFRRLGPAPQRG